MPEARYPIQIQSNATEVGNAGATALEQMRQKILGSQDAVRGYGDALKKLRGTSDEVVKIKKELKDKIDAEKNAISQNTVVLLKQGTTYDKLTQQHKKMNEEVKKGTEDQKKSSEALSKSIGAVGGPVADIQGKIGGLTEILGGAGTAMGAIAIGAAAAVAAVVAVGAAVGALVYKLDEFIFTSANMLRTQRLSMEAFTGSAADAKALSNQIDELTGKVPATREQLIGMSKDLTLAGVQGQTLIDTLKAQAQVTGALGDSAGKMIATLSEGSRASGRFGLDMTRLNSSLQGTGLTGKDVAEALAKNTKTSLADATLALQNYGVTWASGMEALKDATEKKFGKGNLAKMLDLDTLKAKFTDTLAKLTSSVDFEPVLKAMAELAKLFDTSTESGTDLKLIITDFGTASAKIFADVILAVKGMAEVLIGKALDIEIAWGDLQIAFIQVFGPETYKKIQGVIDKFDALKGGIAAMKAYFKPIDQFFDNLKTAARTIEGAVTKFMELEHSAKRIYDTFKNLKWSDIGIGIAKGILEPLGPEFLGKIHDVSQNIVKEFKSNFQIRSPSALMAKEVGQPIGEGVGLGIDQSRSKVNDAINRTATGGAQTAASAGGGSTEAVPPIQVNFEYHAGAGGAPEKATLDEFEVRIKNAMNEAFRLFLARRGRVNA